MGQYFAQYLSGECRETGVQYALDSIAALNPATRPDFIAARGLSGLVLGSIVARELGIPVVIVRKPEEKQYTHCGSDVVGLDAVAIGQRYVVVDDLTQSGDTIRAIAKSLHAFRLLGVVLFTTPASEYKIPLDNGEWASVLPSPLAVMARERCMAECRAKQDAEKAKLVADYREAQARAVEESETRGFLTAEALNLRLAKQDAEARALPYDRFNGDERARQEEFQAGLMADKLGTGDFHD